LIIIEKYSSNAAVCITFIDYIKTIRMKYLCTIAMITCCMVYLKTSAQNNFDSVEIKAYKMNDKIYMLEGSGGNIGLLVGQDGVVMIDDQFAPLSEKIKAAIEKISVVPVRFVINTHFHGDHVGGNENFGKDGAIIVAQSNSRLRMSTDQFNATFKQTQKAAPYDALPKVTFGDSVTLHLNGETLQVTHIKNAHTDGDAIIYFKESNIIHTGDVFVRYGLPFIDQPSGGSIDGMIAGCDVIMNLADDQTKIIPGHGAIASKKDVADYKSMLVTIRNRIVDAIKQGKTVDQVIAMDPTKEYTTSFERSAFILLVYDSLKGK